jgi:hypothetical protein
MNLPKNIGYIALLITALMVDTAANAIADAIIPAQQPACLCVCAP